MINKCMQQIIKRYFWIAVLIGGMQASWGFALLGEFPQNLPNASIGFDEDSWQTAVIGYDLAYADSHIPGNPVFLGDIGGPKNIAEGFRRNEPVVYYVYDVSFSGFFGVDGETAVDNAFNIMNAVPAADHVNLSLYPDQAMFPNFTAQANFLTDLKSVTLHLLVEQMGLADPERFSWTLHDRADVFAPIPCPLGMAYTVVQRNYADLPTPINNIQYSAYINDILYTYFLVEDCTGPNPLAFTVPFSSNPNDLNYTAVAANNSEPFGFLLLDQSGTFPTPLSGGLQVGYFYTGLTRDDVAGLVYLYHTNNVNWEVPDPDSLTFLIVTDATQQAVFPSNGSTNSFGVNGAGFYTFDGTYGYGDYGWLIATSVTNSPAVLQALYPGLIIASSYSYVGYVTNYVFSQYFTNSGVGTTYPPPLILVTASNKVVSLQERYVTTFENVFPVNVSPTTTQKIFVTSITPNTGAPYPAPPVTNSTVRSLTLNTPSGYFFVLPLFQTNVCPLDFISRALTNVIAITNFLTSANTNIITPTNTSIFTSTAYEVGYFTNYQWIIHPVTCSETAAVPNQYQGIGKVQFQRVPDNDYDYQTGQFYNPITNYYNMVVFTNSQWQTIPFARIVTQPDILIDASDQGQPNTFIGTVNRNINFTPSPLFNRTIPPWALAGPGTINNAPNGSAAITQLTYDKIGASVWNGDLIELVNTTPFLGQYGSLPALAWASFDASTNAPELYPNGTSLQNLQNQLAITLAPSAAPNGNVGVSYSVHFNATGGGLVTPLTWTATGSPIVGGLYYGLPPGLNISSNGTISGTPTTPGTYDFVLTLQDSSLPAIVVNWNMTITIN